VLKRPRALMCSLHFVLNAMQGEKTESWSCKTGIAMGITQVDFFPRGDMVPTGVRQRSSEVSRTKTWLEALEQLYT
jgi:hypothetical protein